MHFQRLGVAAALCFEPSFIPPKVKVFKFQGIRAAKRWKCSGLVLTIIVQVRNMSLPATLRVFNVIVKLILQYP